MIHDTVVYARIRQEEILREVTRRGWTAELRGGRRPDGVLRFLRLPRR